MSDPFRVRLTGSSAGTLDQVIVQIELVDRAIPLYPKPWAWYRGDQLTGYTENDEVSVWDDETTGERNLTQFTSPLTGPQDVPLYTADAGFGAPGVKNGVAGSKDLYWFADDPEFFPNGITVLAVGKMARYDDEPLPYWATDDILVGNFSGGGGLIQFQLAWTRNAWAYQNCPGLFSPNGIDGGNFGAEDTTLPLDPATFDGSFAALYRQGAGQTDFTYGKDGAPGVDNTYSPISYVFTGDPAYKVTVVNVSTRNVESAIAELIIFDAVVDPVSDPVDFGTEGVLTINEYLAVRYPRLAP